MELTPELIEKLASRSAKAKEIYDQGRVYQILSGTLPLSRKYYAVTTSKGAWMISASDDDNCHWKCACPDSVYRVAATSGYCKHVLAIVLYEEAHPPVVSVTGKSQLTTGEQAIADFFIGATPHGGAAQALQGAPDPTSEVGDNVAIPPPRGEPILEGRVHRHRCPTHKRVWNHLDSDIGDANCLGRMSKECPDCEYDKEHGVGV